MNNEGTAATDAAPPDDRQRIDGRGEFEAALRSAFEALAATGAREVWLADEDFAGWPLGERAVIERLDAWAGPNRRLVLLARRFDAIGRKHPRWVVWRGRWSHLVTCRTRTDRSVDPWPTWLVAPGTVAVRLIDPVHHRGWRSTDPRDIAKGLEAIDALSQQSVEAFPATTLGL